MIGQALIFALTIVAPQNGATVPTLSEEQKAFLSGSRAETFLRVDNAADRKKLFSFGAHQKPVNLVWDGPTNAVYELSIVRDGNEEETFVLTNRVNVHMTNLQIGSCYHWMIREMATGESASSSFLTEENAPRLLRAGGVSNFRDLGGWRTDVGKRVRENMIFRSAGLRDSSKSTGGFLRKKVVLGDRRVTDEGIAVLRGDFKIKTDLELRTQQETAGMNGSVLGGDVKWQCVSLAAYSLIDNPLRGREPMAKVFRIFTKRENYPILMHCSGGRDRTGTLAFLLNGVLGVSADDLCHDWTASVFSDFGMKFTSDRIQSLIDYLNTLPGNSLKERIERYFMSCGVTADEINAFRSVMIE